MRPSRLIALGLLHGPTEVLPVSSSAHTKLLAGEEGGIALEVALHAGSLPALVALSPRPRPWFVALTTAPAAAAGLVGERFVAGLGRRATALGLLGGAVAMVAADRRTGERTRATAADALAIGLAQAAALVPGVSRTGATFAAARARGFTRESAWSMSREAAVPVVVGAVVRTAPALRREMWPGIAAAAVSSLAAVPLASRSLPAAPFAAYRAAVALALLLQSRR
jgi:undecaprenyl-diphosphatase